MTGVAPVTGTTTPTIAESVITVGGVAAVAGNTAVITPEPALFVDEFAPLTVKKSAPTPDNV